MINLKDVSWWMSIKNAYIFRAPTTVRLFKKRCISLIARRKPSYATHKYD
jgi:hypothetical protein